MKIMLTIALSLFTSLAFACTDFTGTYRDQEYKVYSVNQAGCSSIVLNNDEGTFSAKADGQFRVSSEDQHARVLTAILFSGKDLIMDHHVELKVALPPEVPVEIIPVRIYSIYGKLGNGDLGVTTTVYNANGQVLSVESSQHQKL